MSSDDPKPSGSPRTLQTCPLSKEQPSLTQKNEPHLLLHSLPDRIVEEDEEEDEEVHHPSHDQSSPLSHQQETIHVHVDAQQDSIELPFSPEQEATGEGKSALQLSSKKDTMSQEDANIGEEQKPSQEQLLSSVESLQGTYDVQTNSQEKSWLVDSSQETLQSESLGEASNNMTTVAVGELDAVDGLADEAELQTFPTTDAQQQKETTTILPFHPQNGREETTGELKVIATVESPTEDCSLPGPSHSDLSLKEEIPKSELHEDESAKDKMYPARDDDSPGETTAAAEAEQQTSEHDATRSEGPHDCSPAATVPEEVGVLKVDEKRVWSKTSSKEDDEEEEDEEDELHVVSFLTMGNRHATCFINMAEEEVSYTT